MPYVILEDHDVLEYAKTDPRGFLEQFETGAIIDEPQRYPDLSIFQKFMKLCAGRIGSILNKSSLSNDAGISEKSCTRWLRLLEQSSIIVLLRPYHNNFNKRQIKSPKMFFVDSGSCLYLLGIKKQ